MRLLACAAVVSFFAACASTPGSPNSLATSNGRVAGVVKLPEQLSSEQPCDRISVVAMAADQQVGTATVRQSRNRCTYQFNNLPEEVDLGLQVKVDGLQCDNGAEVSADSGNVKLQKGEIRTHDLQTSCG